MRISGKSFIGGLSASVLFLLACGWGKHLECLPYSPGAAPAHWVPPSMENQCYSIGLSYDYRAFYLSEPENLKYFTLGFDKFIGDLLFLDVIGSTRWESGASDNYLDWMYSTGVAVSVLHPQYAYPYYAIGTFLSFNKEKIPLSNDIFERGMRALPDDFNMPFYIAYNYFWELGEKEAAAPYFAEACRKPDAPPHMCTLAGRLMLREQADPYEVAQIVVAGYCVNALAERAKIIRHDFEQRILPMVEDPAERRRLSAWFERQIERCRENFGDAG